MVNSPNSFAALVEQSLVKVVDFQKTTIDLYAREATGVIDAWKKMAFPGTTYVADAAGRSIQELTALQKNMLDLFVRQSVKGIDMLRPAEPEAAAEPPGVDSADTLMTQQEKDAAVEMVDGIVAELAEKPDQPVVQHAASQQKVRRAQAKRS